MKREPIQGGDQNGEFTVPHPICRGCNKAPDEIKEYREMGREHGMLPASFVVMFEGTLNRETGGFMCTACYIRAGSPSTPTGWHAP